MSYESSSNNARMIILYERILGNIKIILLDKFTPIVYKFDYNYDYEI
jgi:hypothetical protein